MTLPEPDSFLSGDAGDVTAPWRRVKRTLGEAAFGLADLAAGTRREADRLASRQPPVRVLVGCGWHTLRRACPQGVIMAAHSAGRVAEAVRPRPAREDEAA